MEAPVTGKLTWTIRDAKFSFESQESLLLWVSAGMPLHFFFEHPQTAEVLFGQRLAKEDYSVQCKPEVGLATISVKFSFELALRVGANQDAFDRWNSAADGWQFGRIETVDVQTTLTAFESGTLSFTPSSFSAADPNNAHSHLDENSGVTRLDPHDETLAADEREIFARVRTSPRFRRWVMRAAAVLVPIAITAGIIIPFFALLGTILITLSGFAAIAFGLFGWLLMGTKSSPMKKDGSPDRRYKPRLSLKSFVFGSLFVALGIFLLTQHDNMHSFWREGTRVMLDAIPFVQVTLVTVAVILIAIYFLKIWRLGEPSPSQSISALSFARLARQCEDATGLVDVLALKRLASTFGMSPAGTTDDGLRLRYIANRNSAIFSTNPAYRDWQESRERLSIEETANDFDLERASATLHQSLKSCPVGDNDQFDRERLDDYLGIQNARRRHFWGSNMGLTWLQIPLATFFIWLLVSGNQLHTIFSGNFGWSRGQIESVFIVPMLAYWIVNTLFPTQMKSRRRAMKLTSRNLEFWLQNVYRIFAPYFWLRRLIWADRKHLSPVRDQLNQSTTSVR